MIASYLEQAADNLQSIEQLVPNWRATHISIRCNGNGTLAQDFALGGRVRGALGHALKEGASSSAINLQKCDWDAPCALDVFFNTQGRITSRLEIPKPWALHCFSDMGDLIINIAVFGVAGEWAGELADALIRGLQRGITTRGAKKQMLKIVNRTIVSQSGIEPQIGAGTTMLHFVSPLMLRQGGRTHKEPSSLLKSIGNRVSGLARWHGTRLDLPATAFSAQVDAVAEHGHWEKAEEASNWKSHSTRQKRDKPMSGATGTLLLPPTGPLLGTLLAMGETTQAGSHTTHGLGKYHLQNLPH